MRSNDNIPEDEMLLAEAIAAAKSRGLEWCEGFSFLGDDGKSCDPKNAGAVCALGALYFANRVSKDQIHRLENGTSSRLHRFMNVTYGNDDLCWRIDSFVDQGESLGWAFRKAMT